MTREETWEALRKWEIVRYLVYYLEDNLVPPSLLSDVVAVDFSCGVGDLSKYMARSGARKVFATQPERVAAPKSFEDFSQIEFKPGVEAKEISATFDSNSIDLFVARMVFQFPTEEIHRIDVDGMLTQVYEILKPGGRLIVCSHEYTELSDLPETWNLDLEKHLKKVKKLSKGAESTRIKGLIELIRTIGIPPREGVHGQTGFGLKALMFVDSLISHGFSIESCGEIEDFTFPIGLNSALQGDMEKFGKLAKQIFELKREKIQTQAYRNKYTRPQVLQEVLLELEKLHPFVNLPIFAVQAIKQ